MPERDEMTLPKFIPVSLQDISAGGASIYSTLKIPKNTILTLDLPFVDLEVKVKLIRTQDTENGVKYGCEFVGINEDQRMTIRQYVFREQMEQRRKGKL